MNKEAKEQLRAHYKLTVLRYALESGNNAKAINTFQVSKSTFYAWKRVFLKEGKEGLFRKKPIAHDHPKKIRQDVIDKVLELRATYQMGPKRIHW